MIWKSILIAFLAVGVLADLKIDEVRERVRHFCKQNGAEDKVDDVTVAVFTFVNTTTTLLQPDMIMEEISQYQSNHSAIREIFRTFCSKTSQLKSSLHSLYSGIAPCVGKEDQANIGRYMNQSDETIDFFCQKEGEKLSLFFTDGGMECYRQQSLPIFMCYNSNTRTLTPEVARKMTMSEQCALLDSVSSCIVKALRNCPASSTADLTEAVLKFARNSRPCHGN